MVFDGSGGSVLQSQSQTMTLDDSFVGGIDSSPIAKQPATDAGSSTRSAAKPTTTGLSTPQTGNYKKTYYIYTFDGKLLAEYDQTGQCTREYIYLGAKLIAEYRPMTDKYFYYTADQINSTRVVTDDSGNVVYSATYSPFGKKIQSSQSIDDSPKPQFSNKEREQTTNLDYFGARYYDNATYRFNSTDPIINKKEAIANPQLWNLYTYCRNNPVNFFDPDGRFDLRHPGDKELERMDGPPSKWPLITSLDRVSYAFQQMAAPSNIDLKNHIIKGGIALQGSLLFVTARFEGYIYMSDDRIGLGASGGGGMTSQVAGGSITALVGIVDKGYSKNSTDVVSCAVNVGPHRVAGASLDLGDDSFNGGSIEYGFTSSVDRYELSVTRMWEKRWGITY